MILEVQKSCARFLDVAIRLCFFDIGLQPGSIDGVRLRSIRVTNADVDCNLPGTVGLFFPQRHIVTKRRWRILRHAAEFPGTCRVPEVRGL